MVIQKYELSKEDTLIINGVTLHRIIALQDIPVAKVKRGQKGGYVESLTNLAHDGNCWISDDAKVSGKAYVCGNAIVSGNATVAGKTIIIDFARVKGNANVLGHCYIGENAVIAGDAYLDARITIIGNAVVDGSTFITCDWVQKSGHLETFHSAEIESICAGIGGIYAFLSKRLVALSRKTEFFIKHLQSIGEFSATAIEDIKFLNDEASLVAENMANLEQTELVIRNTKDTLYTNIPDYRETMARIKEKPKEDVPASKTKAKKSADEVASSRTAKNEKAKERAAVKRQSKKELVEQAMSTTAVRKKEEEILEKAKKNKNIKP